MAVLVVDDSPAYLAALREVVAATEGFALAGAATSGEEAVALAAGAAPDLVLMDVRLPGLGGIEAGRRIARARPQTVVVLLSSAEEEAFPRGASAAAATLDKRRLSPSALADLWEAHSGGR